MGVHLRGTKFRGARASTAKDAAGEDTSDLKVGSAVALDDGSWTLYDPDNLVSSYSYASATRSNLITMNAFTASQNYNWSSGATHRSPRWYKPAKIDGRRLTTDDLVNLTIFSRYDDQLREFATGVVVGICVDPTSVTATEIAGGGAYMAMLATGSNVAMGVWSTNQATTSATGTGANDRAVAIVNYGRRFHSGGVYTLLDASGNRVRQGTRNGIASLPASTDLFWIVGVGTRGNTGTVEADSRLRFRTHIKPTRVDLAPVL